MPIVGKKRSGRMPATPSSLRTYVPECLSAFFHMTSPYPLGNLFASISMTA
jgi:hypothetical protein